MLRKRKRQGHPPARTDRRLSARCALPHSFLCAFFILFPYYTIAKEKNQGVRRFFAKNFFAGGAHRGDRLPSPRDRRAPKKSRRTRARDRAEKKKAGKNRLSGKPLRKTGSAYRFFSRSRISRRRSSSRFARSSFSFAAAATAAASCAARAAFASASAFA